MTLFNEFFKKKFTVEQSIFPLTLDKEQDLCHKVNSTDFNKIDLTSPEFRELVVHAMSCQNPINKKERLKHDCALWFACKRIALQLNPLGAAEPEAAPLFSTMREHLDALGMLNKTLQLSQKIFIKYKFATVKMRESLSFSDGHKIRKGQKVELLEDEFYKDFPNEHKELVLNSIKNGNVGIYHNGNILIIGKDYLDLTKFDQQEYVGHDQ